MTVNQRRLTQHYFMTAPMPCPYLPGRFERKLVTELRGPEANNVHDLLSRAGFRRSHSIAYLPACSDCNACVPVRVRCDGFEPSRSFRRITVETSIFEYRRADDSLIAVALVDILADGLSAVYSFFDPEEDRRGLGTYIVLDLIDEARTLSLPHVYLGYWIGDCRKMSYKMRFQPLEGFRDGQWISMEDADSDAD